MEENNYTSLLEKTFKPNEQALDTYNATCNSIEVHPEIINIVKFQNETLETLTDIVSGKLNKDSYEKISTLISNPSYLEEKIEILKIKTALQETVSNKYKEIIEDDNLQLVNDVSSTSDDTILYNISKEKVKKAQAMVNRRENIQANITKVKNMMISKGELVPNTLESLNESKQKYIDSNDKMEALVTKRENKFKEQYEKIKRLRHMLQEVENSINEEQKEDVEMH